MSTDAAPGADEVWALLVRAAVDGHDGWRRAVIERTGLPFSRIRVLKRLGPGPLALKDLADSATMDRPATTVAVNELERLGLVVRQVHPDNRRCKLVSLTDAGRAMVDVVRATPDPAPPALARLTAAELATLAGLLRKLDGGTDETGPLLRPGSAPAR